jgi:hypothetical protein
MGARSLERNGQLYISGHRPETLSWSSLLKTEYQSGSTCTHIGYNNTTRTLYKQRVPYTLQETEVTWCTTHSVGWGCDSRRGALVASTPHPSPALVTNVPPPLSTSSPSTTALEPAVCPSVKLTVRLNVVSGATPELNFIPVSIAGP